MRISYFLQFSLIVLLMPLISCKKEQKKEEEQPKIFKFNIHEGFTSMDPAFAKNQSNIWVIEQIFDGLVELDNNMSIVPALAKGWNVSNDGKTYTFNLRDNIYFHEDDAFQSHELGNTRHVTAEDFVYSFKRIISPKVASTGAWIFNDKVLRDESGEISDTCFKAVDEYTFKIYLQEPFPAFLQILTMPYAYVVPKEVVEKYGKDFRDHPVGTGAFKFHHYEENTLLILRRNEVYWKKDENGNRLPYLDAVDVSFIKDKKVAFLTFTKGDLDFFSGLDESSKDMVLDQEGNLKDKFKGKFNFEKIPYLNTEYIGFQLDKESDISKNHIFQNKKIRQALNYAIDRNEMIDFIRNGVGRVADGGIIPSALPSFDAKVVKGYNYNPDKARQLLEEAGYPGGEGLPTITLYTQAHSQYREIAELLQKHFEEIGVKMDISINQFATHQEMADNAKINFFRASWIADYPDGENFLTLFYSKNFAPMGPNKTHFKNERFDDLYEQAKTTTNLEERNILYQEMDKIVVDEAPVIFLYYDEVLRFTSNRAGSLSTDPMNSIKLDNVDFK